jgi:hypothetical protein
MSETENNTALTPRKYAGFQKGNPGRPHGSQNKRTQFLSAIGKGNADAIVKKAVECALAGKPWAIEAVLARLFPPAKGRTVTFPMKEITSVEDVAEAFAGLWAAVSQGLLTPDEATQLGTMLKDHSSVLEARDHERRLAAVEAELKRRQ